MTDSNPEKQDDIKENKEGEEKKLTPEEEDKKEIYDAIKGLKPEEANDNIKSKLLMISDYHLDMKKIENDQHGKEYDILMDKYDKQYQKIYDKIEEIVKSTEKIEISDDDCTKYGITNDDSSPQEIKDYWEKVIMNSRYFTINEKDKNILKYIKKIILVKFEDDIKNFRVDFIFNENEFFKPEILSKTYIYDKDGVLEKAIGTEIEWKSKEKNPTVDKVRKKIKKGKKVINEENEEKVESFFDFFTHVDDLTYIVDEATFFKEDLFVNQLEYYLDIVSKAKFGKDDDDLDEEEKNNENNGNENGQDGKKEECKQQ